MFVAHGFFAAALLLTTNINSVPSPPSMPIRLFLEEDGGGKNGAKRRQQNQNQVKPEEPQEKPCPVRAINRILRPATPKELQQLQEKVRQQRCAQRHTDIERHYLRIDPIVFRLYAGLPFGTASDDRPVLLSS